MEICIDTSIANLHRWGGLGFESRSTTVRDGVARFFSRKILVTESLSPGKSSEASLAMGSG
jgi:hypothetical protein